MVAVNYHDDLNEVQGDPVAAALLRAPAAQTPFARIDWWRNLAVHCGLDPFVAVVQDGDERLIVALMRQGGHFKSLANWYSFHWSALATPQADKARLLTALAQDLAKRCRRIDLDKLDGDEAEEIAVAFRASGWSVRQKVCDANHVLSLVGRSWDDYLSARPGAVRSTLKRKRGKVKITIIHKFDPQWFDKFEDIYRSSWKTEESSPAFLRKFAKEEGSAGRLRMAFAEAGGQAVAAQLWTVENGTAFIHKLAHREDARALSPGTTLLAALLKEVIEVDRVALVDFGTGDDAYKRDWMETVRPRYSLQMLRRSRPGNWPLLARNGLRQLLGRA